MKFLMIIMTMIFFSFGAKAMYNEKLAKEHCQKAWVSARNGLNDSTLQHKFALEAMQKGDWKKGDKNIKKADEFFNEATKWAIIYQAFCKD